ncbi:unnamed protein product [Blepharisma stoltei]|uniref:Uncharacterized protein n=1 Tax=Blepharisma stoltei TaxID=1481888 RepID=A0AAU9IS25_9CILI|nr:unnamed protein product [Blepharisma stoltei]
MDAAQRPTPIHIQEAEDKLSPRSEYNTFDFEQSTTAVDFKHSSSPTYSPSMNEVKEEAEMSSLREQVHEIKSMLEGQERILNNFKTRIQEAKEDNLKISTYLSSVDISNLSLSDSHAKSFYMMRSIDYKAMDHPNLSLIHKNDDRSFVSSLMGLDSEIQSIPDSEIPDESSYFSTESYSASNQKKSFKNRGFVRSHVLYLHL